MSVADHHSNGVRRPFAKPCLSPVPTFQNGWSPRTILLVFPDLKYINECFCPNLREQHSLILLLSEGNALNARE